MSIAPKPPQASNNNAHNGQPHGIGKAIHKTEKNKGGGGGKLRYGAMGGYKGVPRKKALSFVNADLREQKRDTWNDVKQERRQFRRTRGDLKHVYNESGAEMRRLKDNSAATYSNATSQASQAQAALAQTLQAQTGAVQGQANSELSRLGLGGTDVGSQMSADAQNSLNVANQNSADNLANLGMASANSGALSNLMIGSNKGQMLSDLGQARNRRDENVDQLRDALHAARAGRGDSVRALLDQMAQTGWSQHMQQAQLQLQRQAQKKNQSYNAYASGYNSGSGSNYSASSYQPTYGYGYSSPSGSAGGYGGGGNSSSNAAKNRLYGNILNTNP